MTNKLDPKSLLCVFLGYNEKFQGYRCYYPPTGKVFISRHVLFDEHDFPFLICIANIIETPLHHYSILGVLLT